MEPLQEMKAIDAIKNDYEISPYARFLKRNGMYSAALYYKNLNETYQRRACRAMRHLMESSPVPEYVKGQVVYASAPNDMERSMIDNRTCYVDIGGRCIVDSASFSLLETENKLEEHIKSAIMENAANAAHKVSNVRWFHWGLHHILDFQYVIDHGILGYKSQAMKALEQETDYEKIQFYEGMLDVVEGILSYTSRYCQALKEIPNPDEDLLRLIEASERIPAYPAKNFYEAFISIQAIMYLCNTFEPGRLDTMLNSFYEGKQDISEEHAYRYIRAMMEDIEKRMSHPGTTHVTIGGSKADGTADYNEVTGICIKAIGGLRTPNMSLRVREDMPQFLWDLYLENTGKGYTQPAIVNEKIYLEGLVEQYQVPIEDAVNYAFGGCTEVMIQGKSCCDSIWSAFNILDVFENTMCNEFMGSETFEEFYGKYIRDIDIALNDLQEQINLRQHAYGVHNPFPLRSLLTGCLESGKNYASGGTEYNFDSTNIYGSTNAINSLYTVKKFYDGAFGEVIKEEILLALMNDYVGYEQLQIRFLNVQKYGNYNKDINQITTHLMTYISDKIKTFRCYRGNGYFMPAIILWIASQTCGDKVGATPDGRGIAQSLADSAGPMQGTDTEGPTSSMGAVLAIPQKDYVGTCVLNLRLDQKNFKEESSRLKVQQLFTSYFKQGGTQLQISVVNRETLLDALENPEKHENIIVRVGGFSDNFIYLTDQLKQQVLKRTEF